MLSLNLKITAQPKKRRMGGEMQTTGTQEKLGGNWAESRQGSGLVLRCKRTEDRENAKLENKRKPGPHSHGAEQKNNSQEIRKLCCANWGAQKNI